MIGGVTPSQRTNAFETEFHARGVENLRQAIRVEKELVAWRELQLANVVFGRGKHAERHTRSRPGTDTGVGNVEQWKVAGADVFDSSVGLRATDDHGGELAGGGALGEKTIGVSHQRPEWKMLSGKGTKRRV